MAEIMEQVYFYGEEAGIRELIHTYTASGDLELVRKEDGCIQFEFYCGADNSEKAVLLERWRDDAALDAHHSTAMMENLLSLIKKHHLQISAVKFEV